MWRALVAGALLASAAWGQSAECPQSGQPSAVKPRDDGDERPGLDRFDLGELNTTLDYAENPDRPALVGELPGADRYQRFKDDLRERTGFTYTVEYAPISQWGAGAWHFEHELNVIGQWTAFETSSGDSGGLLGWYQNGVTLGGKTSAEFAEELGALSPVNGGTPVSSSDVLQHMAWEQSAGGGRWRFMAGKITSRVTFNMNRYAVSDREDFFSPMLVNNPVVSYTARGGIGAFAQRKEEDWYASVMVRDADASSLGLDFDSLGSGNWESLAEFALTPEIEGAGAGTYRLTGSYTDPVGGGTSYQPSSWTLSLSADQDLGESVGALLRYAWADTPLRAFESRLALGIQIKSPFEHPDDRLGFAYWTGDPSDAALRREHGFESFFRLQLSPRSELTPNVQWIFDPALAPDVDVRTVIGLRLRLLL